MSWLSGHSVAQTLLTCLYTQPAALQTMRHVTGRPLYTPSVGPDFRFSEAPSTVWDLPPRGAAPVAPAELPPLRQGSAQHALVSALLAFSTAGLKAIDCGYRALFSVENQSEEDFTSLLFGADCAWNVPIDEVIALLCAAEAAIVSLLPADALTSVVARLTRATEGLSVPEARGSASPGAEMAVAWLREALSPPTRIAGAPARDGAILSPDVAITEDFALGLLARLRFRRIQLTAHTLLSYRGRYAPAPPLRYGGSYDLASLATAARAASALLGLVQATSTLLSSPASSEATAVPSLASGNAGSSPTPAAAVVDDAALGVYPAYCKLIMSGHARVVAHPPLHTAVPWLRTHWAHVHFLSQMPALASHNPHRPYWPSDLYPAEAVTARYGSPNGNDSDSAAARVTAGAYAPATTPLKTLAAAAEQLGKAVPGPVAPAFGSTAGAPAFAAGSDPTAAMVDVPYSGIVDPPLYWPAAGTRDSPAGSSSGVGSARPHVSLHALLLALERFSRRAPDALARAWMSSVLLEMPHQHPVPRPVASVSHAASASAAAPAEEEAGPDLAITGTAVGPAAQGSSAASAADAPSEAAPQPDPLSSFLPEYAATHAAHAHTGMVLGSHCMLELIRVALLDAGCHPDLLASQEGARFVFMLDKVFQNTLQLLGRNRLRTRRLMDVQLRDWNVITGECSYLDGVWLAYVRARCAEADDAYVASGGQHAPAPSDGTAVTVTASGSPTGAASVEEHAQLTAMKLAGPVQTALSQWATTIVRWLQRLHTAIGAECGVFHDDERLALYWHAECMVTAARRGVDRSDGVVALMGCLPGARTLTPYARARVSAGLPLSIHLSETLLPASPGDEDEDELPSLKAAVAAGGRGGKKGGKAGKSAKAAPLSAKDKAAAQSKLAALGETWVGAARNQLQVYFGGTASPSARPPSRAGILLDAHNQLCCALLRLLLGASQLGTYRGLGVHVPPHMRDSVRSHDPAQSIRTLPGIEELLYAPPHADSSLASPPLTIRVDGRTYDSRWKDVRLVSDAPLPLWHKYVDSICNTAVSKATAAAWLRDAAAMMRTTQAHAANVVALAKAAIAGNAAGMGLLPPVATVEARQAAAGAASGGKGKKGKVEPVEVTVVSLPELPAGLSSWDALAAPFDLAEAQRLARVAVANTLTLTALSKDPSAFDALPDGGPGAVTVSPVVSMLDASQLTWRDTAAPMSLATTYDPMYVVAKAGAQVTR